ncbi:disease resistance protein Roq1-like isoform X2 [Prosopis cineraria]|nr:disease resistance protein Roq1-like isoform X2 [Prosopis cineraria]
MIVSSTSFNYQWKYDVFLSFRGEDTRNGFTGHLYFALCERGIGTFIDDGELRKGDEITPTLFEAIEQSRMAIIIFSENYASSTFCLKELVKILQCIKGNGRLVLPIFYHVLPSHVRYQEGKYEEALALHEKKLKANPDVLKSWKSALHKASNISGFHFTDRHEYEYQFIQRIVKEISGKINRTPLHIADYPVGLESRVLKINSLLKLESDNEGKMVGIWGIGGVGKTTIARAVYNSIADNFEGLCFVHDVKENANKLGLEQMQERMLSKILGVDIKVMDVNEGIAVIKQRLAQKKILLILDNVDKREHLEKLAGGCYWFGSGSRIIITTRNKQLLKKHGVETIYNMKELNDDESFELLRWNAFKGCNVDPSYMEVLSGAMQYAQGLPLALEVIGSHLFGKSINEWKSALDVYKRIPDKEIQQILQVSYNSLQEVEKETFLDIACFFKGKEVEYVKDMVEYAHCFDPSYCMEVLKDKCLIKIENGCIKMHDLILVMGREIVNQESPKEPGKRSRLWSHEDIITVLEKNTGTEKIVAIIQEHQCGTVKVNLDRMALRRMTNLKVLFLKEAWFLNGPVYLPSCLRVLQWWGYPATCLPANFDPTNLAVLDLQGSRLLQWLESKVKWENMTILNLKKCPFLRQIPEASGFPNLIELSLEGCGNLIEIPDSIGFLEKLEIFDVGRCHKLRTLPSAIMMPNLLYLGLEHCSSLEKFPEILEKMQFIENVDLRGTNVKLPFSVCNLTRLQTLDMRECDRVVLQPSSLDMLQELEVISSKDCREDRKEVGLFLSCPNVEVIRLPGCNVSDKFLPICLTWFANVECLLSVTDFSFLPACIKDCRLVEKCYLDHSKHVGEISGVPPKLEEMWARDCLSRSILLSQEPLDDGDKLFFMPGSTIREWLHHYSIGPSISLW